jgi:hypothetical protein
LVVVLCSVAPPVGGERSRGYAVAPPSRLFVIGHFPLNILAAS